MFTLVTHLILPSTILAWRTIISPSTEKLAKLRMRPKERVHIKEEHFAYLLGKHSNNKDNTAHAVHYDPIPDHLELMAEHNAVNMRHEAIFNKDWREDVPILQSSMPTDRPF